MNASDIQAALRERNARCSQGAGHCWHGYRGMLHMVVPDGHVVQKCCQCPEMRTVHHDHTGDCR